MIEKGKNMVPDDISPLLLLYILLFDTLQLLEIYKFDIKWLNNVQDECWLADFTGNRAKKCHSQYYFSLQLLH